MDISKVLNRKTTEKGFKGIILFKVIIEIVLWIYHGRYIHFLLKEYFKQTANFVMCCSEKRITEEEMEYIFLSLPKA